MLAILQIRRVQTDLSRIPWLLLMAQGPDFGEALRVFHECLLFAALARFAGSVPGLEAGLFLLSRLPVLCQE